MGPKIIFKLFDIYNLIISLKRFRKGEKKFMQKNVICKIQFSHKESTWYAFLPSGYRITGITAGEVMEQLSLHGFDSIVIG